MKLQIEEHRQALLGHAHIAGEPMRIEELHAHLHQPHMRLQRAGKPHRLFQVGRVEGDADRVDWHVRLLKSAGTAVQRAF